MDDPCGGDKDVNWLGTGEVQGPLPVQGGLAASRAGRKIIGISNGGQVLEVQYGVPTGQLSARSLPSNADGLQCVEEDGNSEEQEN